LWAESAAEEAPLDLEPIVVVASKTPRPLSSVAAQVTVIDAADMERGMVEDIDGLLKYEPGLDLQTDGTRFGATSINIRGIGGNRVDIRVDGVPARDLFSVGAYSSGGRMIAEPDRIQRVEVLHGPASVMYGSNALGGVFAVTTWNPSDLLARSADSWWLGLRGGYQGMNESWVASGVAAWGEGPHGFLVAGTYRSGHELDNKAPAGTPQDPQDWDSSDYMFRYTYGTEAGNRLRLTANKSEREAQTRMNSQLGYGPRFRWTTALTGDDSDVSQQLALDFDFMAGDWEQGLLRFYDTRAETDQLTLEERARAPSPVRIQRRFYYSQEIQGFEAQAFRPFDWGASEHRLGVGSEWNRSKIEELRDGLQSSLVDGSSTNVILGEDMPVRDFPISETGQLSLWVQDEISLADGRLELIPALRWDRYDLDPKPDSIWLEDTPNTEVVSVSEDQVTPRLGLVYHPGKHWSFYGQYSEGFRAPPFEDANIGFEIPLFGFRAIPNPDLKSETSQGVELGARYFTAFSRLSLALFHTDYDDFIESRVLIGFDPATGDLIFQSRNIDNARIKGVDLRWEQNLGAWSGHLEGWVLDLAAWWAEGENRQNGQPLNEIAPPQAILGIRWSSEDLRWDLGAAATFTAAKHASDIDMTLEERFATPSWVTFDLTAGWRPMEHLEIRAGVFNLFDETYWRWLDVARLDADNPMIPLLSRPGRNYSATLRFSY
jgi:hemoglobin/transferrin/lactoferrin receptor protein